MTERESMDFDVVIVGAGPAGLGAAIRLRQLCEESGQELSVCVVEKGSEVGAHILSGAVLEPRALDELIPDWRDLDTPIKTAVKADEFRFLTAKGSLKFPHLFMPSQFKNKGNYIISLGNLCRWLAGRAEDMGVEVYPGFAAAEVLYGEDGRVEGVATGDMGRAEDGSEKAGFEPGIELRGKYTLFAEGVRGSLSESLMEKFGLREGVDPQTYGLGIKELWEVAPEKHNQGLVSHTAGWPMDAKTYGGSFMYHLEDNQVAVGFVVALDYQNPYMSPFEEFQRFKTHPAVRPVLEGGRRIAYGARAINEGGLQSIPKLVFPGGALIGCSAGFLNVPKIKGSHTAMKTGMLAAEAVFDDLKAMGENVGAGGGELVAYPDALEKSWVYKELRAARNSRPSFRWGLLAGTVYTGIDLILGGRLPWTLHPHADHDSLKPADSCRRIDYPKPDGEISFDRLSSVYLSNTNHEEDQPVHLQLKDGSVPISHNLAVYDAPEQRYCPAGVYEILEDSGEPRLQINAQNCLHCKTCDIKDPTQNINWVVPEGGGGPNYPNM